MVDLPERRPPTRQGLLAGRYRLGARRGSSVEAAAFEAVDEQLQRDVLVKIVHPDLTAQRRVRGALEATVAALADLHHPNLAALLDHGLATWNGQEVLYVVSEHLTGGSLRDLIDRGRTLTPSQAVVVGLDACKALDALHRRGIFHGDVRPATIVFGADRRLRLVDAGVTFLAIEATGGVVKRSNDVARYTAPEIASGAGAQPRSDVYSLCLALVEAITGTVPFVGDSTVATLANRVDRLLPVSADLGALAPVLERAGRPDPEDRSTAAEFGRALVQAAEHMPRPEPLPLLVSSLFSPSGADAAPVREHEPAPAPAPEPQPQPQPQPQPRALVEPPAVPGEPLPPPTGPAPAADAMPPIQPAESTAAISLTTLTGGDEAPAAAAVGGPAVEGELLDEADEFPDPPPAAGPSRRWFIALLAVLAVAGGLLAWYNTRPDELLVPEVTGMEADAARNVLADFTVVAVEEASESVPVGQVIRTDPTGNTRADKGSTVTMYVSTGPAPRVLPELTGLTLSDAKAKLEGMGLVVELADPVYDESVPNGTVISWSVPESPSLTAGATVLIGTTVRLVTSAGPAPRTVPDLTGMTLEQATATLASVGLQITQLADEYSDLPVGQVVRQDPAVGASAERGATIGVALSKGPEMVSLPPLTGLNHDQVRAALENAGFVVGTVYGNTSLPLNKTVVDGQEVTAGFTAPKGTVVDLVYIPDEPEPTTTTVAP